MTGTSLSSSSQESRLLDAGLASKRRMVAETIALVCAVVTIAWPYLRYPMQIFYNRYFEATMTFDPVFAYATYASGWTTNFHLGYPTLTEPSYLSIFTIAIALFHGIGGTGFASHAYPLCVAGFAFGSMWTYLATRVSDLGASSRALVAFFFTVNPITAGMVHEGYSGMMIDYALIPLVVCFIDWAVRTERPLLLGLIPVFFTATSMFKLPEVAIAFATITLLRWSVWRTVMRTHPRVTFGLALAFTVNAYWAIPMVLNLKLHSFLPIQDDTAGEIALSTRYSTLSNVVLGRVFGIFENDAGLCTSCGYYTSAAFTVGMTIVIALAIWGIVRLRAWTILALLGISIVMATGYHYQDDLIGIPYQLLMQLPTFGIFRSSGVFSIVTFLCYSLGLAFAAIEAQRFARFDRRALGAITFVGVSLSSWPMISGAIFEHGTTSNGVVSAPNFYVDIPPEYASAREALRRTVAGGTTLIVPNENFAAYRFGAYVQDFLPAYLGRPTLQRWYWRENNADVDRLLSTVTSTNVSSLRLAALMYAMRIDSVLFHDDTIDRPAIAPARYGRIAFRQGKVVIYRPLLRPVPFVTEDAGTIAGIGGSAADVPVLEALTHRTISDDAAAIGCDGSDAGFAFVRGPTTAGSPVVMPMPIKCSGVVALRAYVSSSHLAGWRLAVFRKRRTAVTAVPSVTTAGAVSVLQGDIVVRKGDMLGLIPSVANAEVLGITASRPGESLAGEQSLPWSPVGEAIAVERIDAGESSLVLHESNDPSWIALRFDGPRVTLLPKFNADGFANGWRVRPGMIVVANVAQIGFFVGLAIASAALIALWRVVVSPYRPWSYVRRSLRSGSVRPS